VSEYRANFRFLNFQYYRIGGALIRIPSIESRCGSCAIKVSVFENLRSCCLIGLFRHTVAGTALSLNLALLCIDLLVLPSIPEPDSMYPATGSRSKVASCTRLM
jgi:hypothetical protein